MPADSHEHVPGNCRLIGRWRIIGADLWERDYLDMSGPATLVIRSDNTGDIAFGVLQAHLDLGFGPALIAFTWSGLDDMNEVRGDGQAALLDDGTLEITFTFDSGDEAIMTARRERSSEKDRAPWSMRN